MANSYVFIGSWWSWCQINVKATCGSYHRIHQKHYPMDVDCTGGLNCSIKIDWQYNQPINVHLSIPNYNPNASHEFQHQKPKHHQHSPHQWERPKYGATRISQGRKCTINTTRPEMKTNPESGENITLLCPSSKSHTTSCTWIHIIITIKRNVTNRNWQA